MTARLDIWPGVDCRLRLVAETPAGFHLLGKFDSYHDAMNAKRAAEQADQMLAALISPAFTTPAALNAVAADLQRRIDGDA